MRYKSPNPYWLKESFPAKVRAAFASFLLASSASAFDAGPIAPHTAVVESAEQVSIFYPDPTLRVSTDYYLSPDFYFPSAGIDYTKDLGVTGTLLTFAFSAVESSKPYVWVYALSTSSTRVPVRLDVCDGGACPNENYYQAPATVGQISISVNDICRNTTGGGVTGCDGAPAVFTKTGLIPGVTIYIFTSASTTAPTTDEIDAGRKFRLVPQIAGPQITACPPLPGFFPGDEELLIDTNAITAQANGTSGGSPSFTRVWVAASKQPGGLPANNYAFGAERYRDNPHAQGEIGFVGYENSTAEGGGILYEMDIGIQDSAGVITFCGDGPSPVAGYPIQDAFATNIQGFLRESNCFVATASFRDGRAPSVMLLRQFRDEVLTEFSYGREFVAWYYEYGPRAADWLLEHPTFRVLALSALLPLQALAWIAVHPAALLAPVLSLLVFVGFLFGVRRRSLPLFAALVTMAASTVAPLTAVAADPASSQPFIDSLISELPAEEFPARTAENPDPYIQSVKKNLAAPESTDGYTEELRQELPSKDGSEGYSERLSRGIPKETGSAIEDYRKGKKLRANKGSMEIRSAFGFKLAAATTRTYSAGANQDVAFEQVYGDSWLPDFTFHYEYRPFTSSVINRLALYGSLGAAFTKADGVLDYQGSGQFGSRSRTEFRFVSIPANIGLMYRASVADFVFPFFGGGPSMIGFVENRNDDRGGQRGYTFGYWFTGGVAFGLDWLSPRSSWAQYETLGTKHSYLTIDYTYLESMAGGLVEFTVDGIQVGFTFEM